MTISTPKLDSPRFKWWHAALFWVVVNACSLPWPWREELFPGFQAAPLRPPGAVFPVIWFIINVCALAAGLRILNRPDTPRRSTHLKLQGAFWFIFAIFPFFTFGLSSPIVGGVLTQAIFVIALAEVIMLWRDERMSAYLLLPLLAWGAFAGIWVSTWQYLHNRDPWLGTPALLP
ncbi:hypothetical protein SAMD00079811_41880 [Scytonema sp. HK-05]|uniref:tryptophan-rich sensory protein n=1 Tax=Scytonema sp. HK-05 TaxID=1137095 RepID=UPI00093786CE|nr:TspO/MBR family protein [Scytonema sp. HK-05]OKH50423.1 hypothetical protein NIES2130_34205 [Scytonema sp. HK-05]BAY46576.1 hypothetical protein SAMD00079811_41880 [Scytonema sp. HK-05]